MIDNLIFLIVFSLIPFLCWKAMKQDSIEDAKVNEEQNQVKEIRSKGENKDA